MRDTSSRRDRKSVYSTYADSTYQGVDKGVGVLRRVWRDVGGRIRVESYDDSTQEGGGDTAAMEHNGRGDWTPDLQDFLPGKGRTAEMSSGGVPGKRGNEDSNAGALRAPAYPQHRGDHVERKPPPHTVHLMRHAIPPESVERAAPGHSTV